MRPLVLVVVPVLIAAVCSDARPIVARAACADSLTVSLEPASPREGSLFRVRVSGIPANADIAGVAVGEPLHFTAGSQPASHESLAGVPIDAGDSLGIAIRCTIDDQADTLAIRVPVKRGNFPVERLRVAPAFGRQPDSALAARIRRESERAAEVAVGSHETPRLWTEPFLRPRSSRITSGFGGGREYNGTITSRHTGTDFAGATGAPIRAANRGVVRIVDRFFYGGNVVYLDHGAGLTSAYLHLSAHRVAPGDTVERGQIIGAVGATGRVTGPHLHFIVRYGRVTVDAMTLFAILGDST
jgi:murein DD-endopeptidase MepM/ murein hydrolase activator NlpD